jgi:hypothetical protein
MTYTFEYIETIHIDPTISGNNESTKVIFRCEGFLYYANCYQGILQSVSGELPSSYLNWSTPPTEQQTEQHDIRREIFNENHSIIQNWLDTL